MGALPDPLITIRPEILSGAPTFTGTRVPIQALLDYVEAGEKIDEFLIGFPSVSRAHAEAVLKRIIKEFQAHPERFAG